MPDALIRAGCLAVVVCAVAWLPWQGVAFVIGMLLGWALVANRTRRHPVAGRTILVTGASSGLGRALAIEAARRRAHTVFLVARSVEKLEQTAREMTQVSPTCTPVVLPCDLTDPDAIDRMVEELLEAHGCPDVLVNNAGAGAWQHIEEGSHADALAHMACPTLAATWLCQALVPAMANRRSGHILNVTSAASLGGLRAAVTYGSARWAMRGLAVNLRADLAELAIGVTLLNASEIAGTSYFDDAPGKAGASSRSRMPWLFQLPLVTAFTRSTTDVAGAALDGVESGTFEVLYPRALLGPVKVLADLSPEVVYHLAQLGPAGRR